MLYKTSSANTADYIAVLVRAQDGAGSFTQNLPVCYLVDGSSADGIGCDHPDAGNLKAFAGIMRTSVAIGGYGYATAWGNHASVLISNEGSSVTITAGDALIPLGGTRAGMSSVGGATLAYTNLKYAIQTVTVTGAYSAAAYTNNPIVRAL